MQGDVAGSPEHAAAARVTLKCGGTWELTAPKKMSILNMLAEPVSILDGQHGLFRLALRRSCR